jgi:hypothetical protein
MKSILFFAFAFLLQNANAQIRVMQQVQKKDTAKLQIRKLSQTTPTNTQPVNTQAQPTMSSFLLNTPTTMVQAAPVTVNTTTTTTTTTPTQNTVPAFVPSPEVLKAYQWWRNINPHDFSIYSSPFQLVPHTRSDTTVEKFAGKKSLTFKGWLHQQGWPLWKNDSLVHLRALPNLVQLDLPAIYVNDSAFQVLGTVNQLRAIYYHSGTNVPSYNGTEAIYPNYPVTDIGLAALLQNTSLEYVGFQDLGRITDAGFAYFTNLRNLKVLQTLGWTGITDQALLSLQGCESLETLYLVRSNITDQGLSYLLQIKNRLPRLKTVYLNFSKVTTAGIQQLQQNWGSPLNVQFNY